MKLPEITLSTGNKKTAVFRNKTAVQSPRVKPGENY